MKQVYSAPEFEISMFDVEDILTMSIGSTDITEGGANGWVDI